MNVSKLNDNSYSRLSSNSIQKKETKEITQARITNNSVTPMKSIKSSNLTKATTLKQANFEQTIFDIIKPMEKKKNVYEKGDPLADVE